MLILAALIPLLLSLVLIGCTIGLLRASIKGQKHARWLRGLVFGFIAYIGIILVDAFTGPIPATMQTVLKSLIALFGMYSLIFAVISFTGCVYFFIKKKIQDNRIWLIGFIVSGIVFIALNILNQTI